MFHKCDYCPYESHFKANCIRHVKSKHEVQSSHIPTPNAHPIKRLKGNVHGLECKFNTIQAKLGSPTSQEEMDKERRHQAKLQDSIIKIYKMRKIYKLLKQINQIEMNKYL